MNADAAGSTLEAFVHWSSRDNWYGFKFEFRNYYMTVKGFMPMESAKKLYYDSGDVGRTDVRVAGHCACPAPEGWAEWYDDDGKKLYTLDDKAEIDKLSDTMRHRLTLDPLKERYVDNREEIGHAYITTYHLDSPGGLILVCREIELLAATNKVSKLLLPHMREPHNILLGV